MPKRAEKARRARLRRSAGLKRFSELAAERPRPETVPLRAGPAWRVAHACFECRKSFKRRPRVDTPVPCPQCGRAAAEMGRAFKAPRSTNAKQWLKIRRLWEAGYRFEKREGAFRAPPFPRHLRDVDAFIKEHPRHAFRLESRWPRALAPRSDL